MKVKTTIGWLAPRLAKAISHYRLKMTYGSEVTTIGSWFSKDKFNTPYTDSFEYWKLMCQFHPWKDMFGAHMCIRDLSPETEIWLSAEVVGRILTATGESK